MITAYFDMVTFLSALDQVREERQLSWYSIYRETGVYGIALEHKRNSWLRGEGAMSVQTMAALALWSGLDIRDYIKQEVKDA